MPVKTNFFRPKPFLWAGSLSLAFANVAWPQYQAMPTQVIPPVTKNSVVRPVPSTPAPAPAGGYAPVNTVPGRTVSRNQSAIQVAPTETTVAAAPNGVMRYTLAESIRIGQEKHPSISALRSSLNAATLKNQALNDIHPLGDFFLQDLTIRRDQSEKGILAATAELNQAAHEVNYAVIRSYYTVIYAREQSKVAKELVDQLEIYLEQVKKIVHGKGGGVKGITQDTEDRLVNILSIAKSKLIEAESGTDRARAALREAMGLEPGTRVDVADELLPEIKADIPREAVVKLAMERRGEITLAQIGADVTRLEVMAQWSRRIIMQNPTYANGGDIHARSVPAAQRDPDYKPGAIGPEMPDMLIGHRETRTATAQQYADRAAEAARQARSLIGLEAENAHAKWIEASRKAVTNKEAAKVGRDMVERAREASGGSLNKEEILITEATAAQAFASNNEALYQQIIALANLERITAGGIRVNFPGR
jgi:hypothetical protein